MRKGFTLIEMMISISILSVIILFLHDSFSNHKKKNLFYGEKIKKVSVQQDIIKTIFLDFTLSKKGSIITDTAMDNDSWVFMETSNSIFKRIRPYVSYIVKNNELIRIESSERTPFSFEFNDEIMFTNLGKVTNFKVYNDMEDNYLVDFQLEGEDRVFFKARSLN